MLETVQSIITAKKEGTNNLFLSTILIAMDGWMDVQSWPPSLSLSSPSSLLPVSPAGKNERSSYSSYGRESNPHCHQVSPAVAASLSWKIRKKHRLSFKVLLGSEDGGVLLWCGPEVSGSEHLVIRPSRHPARLVMSEIDGLLPVSEVKMFPKILISDPNISWYQSCIGVKLALYS